MKKTIISILLSFAFLICVAFVPIHQTNATNLSDWGDEYTNSEGQHICICSTSDNDCRPCYKAGGGGVEIF